MTDLTEQLQELSGDYWCEITESPCIEQVYFPTCSEDIIVKVLAKVPSYNEWKAKLEENEQLKELLNKIKTQCELIVPKNGLNPVGNRERLCKEFLNLIDEVLR